jgi:hypothetical protein
MFFNELRRLAAWLVRPQAAVTGTEESASVFDFDPMWHGDHWQNLLSSPMDARHYVMEDWTVSPGFDFSAASPASSGN